MTPRQANYYSHLFLGPFVVARGHQTTSVHYRTLNFRSHREESAMHCSMFHCGTFAGSARRFLSSFRSRLTSLVASLLRRGAFQCMAVCINAWISRVKSSGQMVGRSTTRSNPFSKTSPTRFGLKTLRLRSPRFVAAAFVPLSGISAANENGLAMRSPPSFLKSSVVTKCGTSRSFPNGDGRPF